MVSLFANDIIAGNNINSMSIRAQTVREYLDSVNDLFASRGFTRPVDFGDRSSPATVFYENVKTWEKEPNRRTHITPEFITELRSQADRDLAGLGLVSAMLDFTLLGRYTGIRLAEYGQSTQKKIDYYAPPVGSKIMKAFRRLDFEFFEVNGRRIVDPASNAVAVHSVTICWRVQKNRRNGQKISWIIDNRFPLMCPVRAALRIYVRSIELGMKEFEPMGVYRNKHGRRVFITGTTIAQLFKSIARNVYPDITSQELSQFSAHMIRVSAAVLLQIADKPADYIKLRLRWEGDSYRVYLRNTSVLAYQHLKANIAEDEVYKSYLLSAENLNHATQPPPEVDTGAMGIDISI